jgi:Flp pilus assembly protein TadD
MPLLAAVGVSGVAWLWWTALAEDLAGSAASWARTSSDVVLLSPELQRANRRLEERLALLPPNAEAHCRLAAAYESQHLTAQAVKHYTEALRVDPHFTPALNNLAWIRAANRDPQVRDGAAAVALAELACKLTDSRDSLFLGTLAAAYAEAGRFDEAIAMARQAREVALAAGQTELAEKDRQLLELFQARKPYHEP